MALSQTLCDQIIGAAEQRVAPPARAAGSPDPPTPAPVETLKKPAQSLGVKSARKFSPNTMSLLSESRNRSLALLECRDTNYKQHYASQLAEQQQERQFKNIVIYDSPNTPEDGSGAVSVGAVRNTPEGVGAGTFPESALRLKNASVDVGVGTVPKSALRLENSSRDVGVGADPEHALRLENSFAEVAAGSVSKQSQTSIADCSGKFPGRGDS
jgi:hypothetical protein